MRFSCTEEFSPSNFFIIRLNLGRAMLPIMPRNISRNGIAMRNILARGALILWAYINDITNSSGALRTIRKAIVYAICIVLTSVVILVTSEAVLNRSIFENEKL